MKSFDRIYEDWQKGTAKSKELLNIENEKRRKKDEEDINNMVAKIEDKRKPEVSLSRAFKDLGKKGEEDSKFKRELQPPMIDKSGLYLKVNNDTYSPEWAHESDPEKYRVSEGFGFDFIIYVPSNIENEKYKYIYLYSYNSDRDRGGGRLNNDDLQQIIDDFDLESMQRIMVPNLTNKKSSRWIYIPAQGNIGVDGVIDALDSEIVFKKKMFDRKRPEDNKCYSKRRILMGGYNSDDISWVCYADIKIDWTKSW
jgi:hypothetical protein